MDEKKHLVYICADRGIPLTAHRGSSVHIREIVTSLASQNLDVTLLATRTSKGETIPPVSIQPIPKEHISWQISRSIQAKSGPEKSREFLDIVRNASLRRSLDRLHRNKPVHFILERMSLFSFAALEFARRRKIPFLLEVNAPLSREHAEHRQMELEDFASSIETVVLSEADRIIAVSSAIRDYAISCGASPEHILVLPNAADKKFQNVSSLSKEPKKMFTIGYVGSLKPWHALDDLLEAFSRFSREIPESLLLIVGDGPERLKLEAEARKKGIKKMIEWTGEVPHDSVPQYLARMDIAAAPFSPVPQFYFSPLKIAEYMAAGRAIAAARIGQVAEILEHGKTALLYKPGDTKSLTECLLNLESDRNLRTRLGETARSAFTDKTWDHNARVILKAARDTAAELHS